MAPIQCSLFHLLASKCGHDRTRSFQGWGWSRCTWHLIFDFAIFDLNAYGMHFRSMCQGRRIRADVRQVLAAVLGLVDVDICRAEH
jgi:hypothetical protein